MKRPKSLLGIGLGAYWAFAADANHERDDHAFVGFDDKGSLPLQPLNLTP
jgi:hypothetical protein